MASNKIKRRKAKRTLKIENRQEKQETKIKLEQLLDTYIKKYNTLDTSNIENKSIELMNSLSKINKDDYDNLLDLQMQLESLKYITETRLIQDDASINNNSDFMSYPEFSDKDFNMKIFKKKEFYINRIPKIILDTKKITGFQNQINNLSNKTCKKWQLNHNQTFLKNYLGPNTPFNGILLFHGTGVGKTCSSITIAEQYKHELASQGKKIYIILNPSIKQNFVKNIFDIEKVKMGKIDNQCTGRSYLDEVGEQSSIDKLYEKVIKKINSRYHFLGYVGFANMIEKIESKAHSLSRNPSLVKERIDTKIKELFSNSVMIIDEAHNIKNTNTGGKTAKMKVLPPILERVVKTADNLKLILLTATPMFDNAQEIVWLLNLLLMNDKRPTIKTRQLFDRMGNLTPDGEKILVAKSRGYISFMRGENIIKFPKRLYPDIYNHPKIIKSSQFPKKYTDGTSIPQDLRLSKLKLINCPMIGFQKTVYNKMESKVDVDKGESSFGAFDLAGIMASNITYMDESDNYSSTNAKNKFDRMFQRQKTSGIVKFKPKEEKYNDFFDLSNLKDYSSKISSIIENIDDSNGIVFIYSQFIWAGVVPLALALEYNGYTKYGGSIWDGPRKADKLVNGKRAQYIIISGDKDLSKKAYEDYLKIESKNQDGEIVKVIIGSETSAEGLDFSFIREVHILDPWHHLNKLEQIIGRAIRNCSHINLPIEQRNVLVYLYAATLSNNPQLQNETIDLKMFRTAENKAKQMAAVEYLLKRNAVDCNLNLEGNRFIDDIWNKKLKIVTSKGTNHEILVKDINGDRLCSYQDCNYKCIPDIDRESITKNNINYNTFSEKTITTQINTMKQKIKTLYQNDVVYQIEDFKRLLNIDEDDEIILFMTLENLLKTGETFTDMYNRIGRVIYKGDYYVFEPLYLKGKKLRINELRRPLTIKKKSVDITKYTKMTSKNNKASANKSKSSNNQEFKVDDASIEKIIESLDERKVKLTDNIQKDRKLSDKQKTRLIKLLNDLKKYNVNWLPTFEKEILVKHLIFKHETKKDMSDTETSIFKALKKTNILYGKGDLGLSHDDDKIWGYKIAKNKGLGYYKYLSSKKQFIDADRDETLQIQKTTKKRMMRDRDPNAIIGFLEEKPTSKQILLKIRDKIGETETTKGTQKKTGSVCGNDGMRKQKILDFIEKVKSGKDFPETSKHLLCDILELYLRYQDAKKVNDKRWFYNLEEAIEMGF